MTVMGRQRALLFVVLFLGPRLMEQLPSGTLLVTVAEGWGKEVINYTPALKSLKGNET